MQINNANLSCNYHRAWAEIHLDRLNYNIEQISSLLKGNTKIMAVVKANAYGHNDAIVAPFLESIGINYFAVSSIFEAEHLRDIDIKGEILVLGYTPPDYAQSFHNNNITATIVSLEHALALSNSTTKTIKCHVALDTGMGRIGLREDSASLVTDKILQICSLPNLSVEGIFTHFSVADSDEPEDVDYTIAQRDFIVTVHKNLQSRNVNIKYCHFLNSAGGAYYMDELSSFVRLGIIMYGLHPNSSLPLPFNLRPIMDLKAEVGYVAPIKKDSFISYGRTFQAPCDMTVAVITIGYADGYSRLLSGKGYVLFAGKKAPIIGKICMDQLMVDVSDIDNIHIGDVVTLIGKDGENVITADSLANMYGTIAYEVLCGISLRVNRQLGGEPPLAYLLRQ